MKRLLILTIILILTLTACKPRDNVDTSSSSESASSDTQSSSETEVYSVPPVKKDDYAIVDYPSNMPQESIGGILGSLSSFVDQMMLPELKAADFISTTYQNEVMMFSITDSKNEAALLSAGTADETVIMNPLHNMQKLVKYAATSGHIINNLTIADEKSKVGSLDFSKYIKSDAAGIMELSEESTKEITKYCADMLAENKDTKLYVLSDTTIAFSLCEYYSSDSLLGTIGFFEKSDGDVYKLKALVDFNC